MTYDITKLINSVDDTKAYLKIDSNDDDMIIGSIIQMVSSQFDEYTHRKLLSQVHTEYYNGNDADRLPLNNYPVGASYSVYIDQERVFGSDTQIESTDLSLDADNGIIYYDGIFPYYTRNIKVVYTAGYTQATIPFELKLACYEAVSFFWYRKENKLWGVQSMGQRDSSFTLYESEMPKTVKMILDRYKRVRYC